MESADTVLQRQFPGIADTNLNTYLYTDLEAYP
jgi:hypothetical protein